MAYTDHYRLADDMIAHLDTVIVGIADPFISSRYVGFVAVAAVTVYELAVKEIFIAFAEAKNSVFGAFTHSHFTRINGRIGKNVLRDDYIRRFGNKYVKRFDRRLNAVEAVSLRTQGLSVITSYSNLIVWRNEFAHAGQIPPTVTYTEVTRAYSAGKELIRCLAESMRR
jgi:hypothetical protein